MKDKLTKGEKFYHKDLNHLICCRDKYFNLCYSDETYDIHLKSDIKRYHPDNSGEFYTMPYKFDNIFTEFIVIDSGWGGGSSGHDSYPDAWQVYCSPLERKDIIIKFHQQTNCFAYTINEVILIEDEKSM
jgi:hypothetical protein